MRVTRVKNKERWRERQRIDSLSYTLSSAARDFLRVQQTDFLRVQQTSTSFEFSSMWLSDPRVAHCRNYYITHTVKKNVISSKTQKIIK